MRRDTPWVNGNVSSRPPVHYTIITNDVSVWVLRASTLSAVKAHPSRQRRLHWQCMDSAVDSMHTVFMCVCVWYICNVLCVMYVHLKALMCVHSMYTRVKASTGTQNCCMMHTSYEHTHTLNIYTCILTFLKKIIDVFCMLCGERLHWAKLMHAGLIREPC